MNNKKARQVFAFYWNHLKEYPALLTGALLSLPLATLLNSYLPAFILANVLGRLSKHQYQDHQVWSSFKIPIIEYAACLMFGLLMWRVVDFFAWRLEANITKDIAEEVLDHLLEESTDFHANHFTGSLVSQTNKLMGGYIRAADTSLFQVYPLFAGILITVIILAHRAPAFVVLLLLVSIAYLYASIKISRPVRLFSAKHAAAESRETGYLADAITNVIAIKSFSRHEYEMRRFKKATAETNRSLFEFAHAHYKQMNYLGTLSRTMSVFALVMAVVSVLIFDINIATVFLIFSYTSSIADGLFSFGNNALRNYNRTVGDAFDMVEILDHQPAILDPAEPEEPVINAGEIQFKNVTFDHESNGDKKKSSLFYDFNLHIKSGEKIGLVGHSGGGKTTFTKLIMRFMDIDGGQILIDGQNIASVTQDDLRRFITYVPQEPLLFHRSLAENISYGKSGAKHDEIVKAAKLAHADDFINILPQKYETLVGERGIKLSGGQRQRVVIARAMLKDAPILVLDEATSALDSESEKLIQDALWKLMEGRTAIVIAHRLSTIQKMDRIVVLDEGRIAEEGTHKQLLSKKGTYAKLWAHQSGGFLDD